MTKQPKPIPEKLIEKTALKIYKDRQKEYSDEDYQKAREYLEQNSKRVKSYIRLNRLLAPVFWTGRRFEDLATVLHRLAIFKILDLVGKAAIVLAVFIYFAEAADRQKQSNYRAWQIINSASGQKSDGGRKEALEDLNENGVPLVGVNLQNADLPEVNLEGASFWGANLEGASFRNANLEGADLSGANLEGAFLSDANLEGAFFWSANLERAKLGSANLKEANFWKANLERAFFGWTNLEGASFDGANLEEASFWDANLKGASFWNANLEGAYLRGANLEGTNLKTANLAGIRFEVSRFQKLTPEQLKQSCFWDKGITVLNEQVEVEEEIPIDVAVIEKAMKESPYDVAACTEYWDKRKAEEAKSGE